MDDDQAGCTELHNILPIYATDYSLETGVHVPEMQPNYTTA